MGIGASILIIAAGAIMTFAVEVDAEGFDINTAGVILMIIGAIGLLVSLVMFGTHAGRRERAVYHDDL